MRQRKRQRRPCQKYLKRRFYQEVFQTDLILPMLVETLLINLEKLHPV